MSEAEEGFLKAHEEHADAIFRFALSKTSNREVALDLMQDTFVRAWEYVRKGNRVDAWKPFLFRIAYNRIVDTYRRHREASLDALEDDGYDPHDESAAEAILATAERSRLRELIGELADGHRTVLMLRFMEGLTPKDIAKIVGCSENAASVQIHRAVKKLKELLSQRSEQPV